MSEMSSFCINLYPDDYKLVKDCLEENGFEVQGDGKYFIFGHVRASAPDEELNEFFNALVDIKTKWVDLKHDCISLRLGYSF